MTTHDARMQGQSEPPSASENSPYAVALARSRAKLRQLPVVCFVSQRWSELSEAFRQLLVCFAKTQHVYVVERPQYVRYLQSSRLRIEYFDPGIRVLVPLLSLRVSRHKAELLCQILLQEAYGEEINQQAIFWYRDPMALGYSHRWLRKLTIYDGVALSRYGISGVPQPDLVLHSDLVLGPNLPQRLATCAAEQGDFRASRCVDEYKRIHTQLAAALLARYQAERLQSLSPRASLPITAKDASASDLP